MGTLIRAGERSFVAAVAVAALSGYVAVYGFHLNEPPIRADGYSYYLYLPAWFIYHDPSLETLAAECCDGTFPDFSAVTRQRGTGAWINPHPIGTAVLIAPFFLLGHILTLWSNLKPDGFSLYYQHAAGLAGVFYLVAGLAVLKKFLRRHFSAGITLAALVSITWGTNLFHYGTYDSVYSHVYSFFLFCSFLALTASWYERHSLAGSLLLGLVAGLIFLTRHANALFLVCFPLYGVFDRQTLAARLRLFGTCIPHLAAMAATAILVAAPQFLMYRAATGSFLADPYANLMTTAGAEAFHFGNPQLLGVLFSVRKGVFFWSPILALSVAGVFVLRGTARSILLPSLIYLPVTVYLAASWWDWQLGGSYGHRALTEGSALLVVPIAALYQSVSGRPFVRTVVAVFAAMAILLSVLQMVQYWLGIIPFSDVSWSAYRASFLRFTR